MKTFKELLEEVSEKKTMSLAQRRKQGQRMKKMAKSSGFKSKRARKMAKMSSKEDLLKRAMKAAKSKIIQKMTGLTNSEYNSKSTQEKMVIDKKVEGKSALIKKMALKMLPVLKKQEMERIQKMKKSDKQEDNSPCWDGYKQIGMKTNSSGKSVPNCVPEENQKG